MQTQTNKEKDMCKTTACVKFQNDGGKKTGQKYYTDSWRNYAF